MTEREKLIDLIHEAVRTNPDTRLLIITEIFTEFLVDFLLKRGVKISSFNTGDKVFVIKKDTREMIQGKIASITSGDGKKSELWVEI